MTPNVYTLYDPGTAEPLEDRFVVAAPFFAVLDGVSGLYHPNEGWRAFAGSSGGQQVVALAQNIITHAASTDSLEAVMERVDAAVRAFTNEHGLHEPHDIPGTTFAVAKVDDGGVTVIQGGDAFAVWQYVDGSVGATPNPNYGSEARLLDALRDLMKKHAGDKDAVWTEYIPLLREAKRLANTPEGYVVLNGDPKSGALWQRKTFVPGELALLLLVTDGLVDVEETKDELSLARTLVEAYKAGGVEALLHRIRDRDAVQANKHVTHAEATAVAIEFT